MRTIVVTGKSGMLASRFIEKIKDQYIIRTLSTKRISDGKNDKNRSSFYWNPSKGEIESEVMEGVDGIVHLSGYPIAENWSDKNIKLMRDSRIKAAELLMRACAEKDVRPEFFISASAIGIYGYGREGEMSEINLPGKGFIADLCRDWEDAALSFEAIGSRVVLSRISLILSPEGGFLAKMKPIFKLGLGAGLGSGKQAMPWIHIDDLCDFIIRAVDDDKVEGPYNLCSNEQIDLNGFGKILAKVMNKPYFMPNVPSIALKLVFGKRSQLFLDTPAVKSIRLQDIPFKLKYNKLEDALDDLIE